MKYKCYDLGLMVGKCIEVGNKYYFFKPICIRSWESLISGIVLGAYHYFDEPLDQSDLTLLETHFTQEIEL